VHRRVESVVWARECARPRGIPVARRLRGTRAQGLAYERKLVGAITRVMPSAVHGQWFHFFADGEYGYCQPDVIRVVRDAVYVIECKLTDVELATEQLRDLYFPVLRCAYARPVRGIIAVRSVHRAPGLAHIASSLREALLVSETRVPVLHWIGSGPI
jgi:hypothetical protein